MNTAESQARIRDYGPVGTAIQAVVCLALGGGLGYFVYQDGFAALRNTYTNPLRIFFAEGHYLNTIMLGALFAALTFCASIVHRIWSVDRLILLTTALLLVADVIPGLSTLLAILLIGKLCGDILRKGDAYWPLSPIGLMTLLVLGAYAVTFLSTESPVSPLANFLPRLPYIILALFLPIAVNTTGRLETLIDYLILASLFSLGVELLQGVGSAATGQILTFAPSGFETFDAPWGPTARLTGLMTHPNRYSNVASTVAVIVLWLALQPKEAISARRRGMMFLVFFLLAVGVFFSWSRSGWLSLAITVGVLPFFRWPHLSPLFLMGGGFIGFLGWTTGAIQAAYIYVRDLSRGSADFRWHIDQIGLQAFFENPVFGVGVEGTKDYFNAYELQVHNAPLQVMADLGLVGIVVFSALMITIYGCLFRVIWAKDVDPRLRTLAMALTLSTLVTLIQGMVEVFLWLKFLWTFIAVLACIHVAHVEAQRRKELVPLANPEPSGTLVRP
ncbi:MAG: O-antigen ligase family protein [Planctomycetota bacterium]